MATRTLMVVFEKSYEPNVTFLKMLIAETDANKNSENTQTTGSKDNTIQIGEMTEKQYNDNKVNLSSSQKILFIGNVHNKKSLETIMKTPYNEHGIIIGQAGNQMIIITDMTPLLLPDSYKKFIDEFKKLSEIPITKLERKLGWNWKIALTGGLLVTMIPFIGLLASGVIAKNAFEDKILIQEQQRRFAILKFYKEYLNTFMKV